MQKNDKILLLIVLLLLIIGSMLVLNTRIFVRQNRPIENNLPEEISELPVNSETKTMQAY